jgi:PRTRC genetic system protein F
MFKQFESIMEPPARQTAFVAGPTISPSYFLAIPRIDSEVPAVYAQNVHPSISRLAEMLAEIGVITAEDIAENEEVDVVIRRVVSRELAKATGKLELITIDANIAGGDLDSNVYEHDDTFASEVERIQFSMDCLFMHVCVIGNAIDALEKLHPGLGQTMFSVLSNASYLSLGLFTIEHVYDNIPWAFGFEEDFEDGGDEEDGYLTKEECLAGSPQWFASPQCVVDRPTVDQMCNHDSTPLWARDIMKASLEVADAYVTGKGRLGTLSGTDTEAAYSMAVIRYSETDQMERMHTDFINMASGCSDCYTEMLHYEVVNLTDVGQFSTWWEGVLSGCRLIGKIDTLMKALTCQPTQ